MTRRIRTCVLVLFLSFSIYDSSPAQNCSEQKIVLHQLAKSQTNDQYVPFLINNVFNYYGNNGDGSFNQLSPSNEGFEWPKGGGDGKTAVFEDGLVWTCYQNGTLKAGGSWYWHGLQAGKILANGSADNPSLGKYRIYRVRPDIGPTSSWDAAMKQKIKSQEGDLRRRYEASLTDSAIYLQYVKDWNEWPAADGAPFTDVNGNGVFDPSVDTPGVSGANQTLWHVSNDLDASRVSTMAGSTPVGLEVQRTIWGYNRSGVSGNTVFIRYRIVNRSGVKLDSMYVAPWADPDLGGASGSGADLGGCDTTLNLGFDYSGLEVNGGYGFPSPAFGYVMVQGPTVLGSTRDSAVTSSGWRKGYRNLPITAFEIFVCGGSTYVPPPPGGSGTTQDWYNVMRGLSAQTGLPFVDPITGKTTKFVAPGNPVTRTGWIGENLGCSDINFALASGPFTLAAGDTQEVVTAATIAQGVDRLSSITALKSTAAQIRSSFAGTSQVSTPPTLTAVPTITPGQNTQLAMIADCRGLNAKTVNAIVRRSDGTTVATVPMFDDGTHGDGAAADGVFGATASVPQQSSALTVDASITYASSSTLTWKGLVNNLTTAGPVSITSPVIVSDNLNSDGIANPGEDVRFGFTLTNNSSVALQNVSVTMVSTSATVVVGSVNVSSSSQLKYDPTDATTYLSFKAPLVSADSTVTFALIIKDPTGDRWTSSVSFPIKLMKNPILGQAATRTTGPDGGDFAISVVDPSKVKNHAYKIYGQDSVNAARVRGYRLVDSTAGTVLLDRQPLPDPLGHTSPVVDGFKVLLGTVDTVDGGFVSVKVTSYAGTPVSPPTSILRTRWSDSQWGLDVRFSTSSSDALWWLNWQGLAKHDYELRITADDIAASEYYLNKGAYQPYLKASTRLPVQIWDVITNTRLIPIVSPWGYATKFDTARGKVLTSLGSGVGWYPISACSVFPYQEPLPDTVANEAVSRTGLLSGIVFLDWQGKRYFPPAGTVIRLNAHHALSSADSWSFNPSQITTGIVDQAIPKTLVLYQNYPNPFNPTTTIKFELNAPGTVSLRVFNVLGQLVTTLMDEKKNEGYYSVDWNSTGIASGVYFYRLEAGSFIQTKKMVVLK